MTDVDMEHGEYAGSSTATPKLYISDRIHDTRDAVELTLGILPAFNLLPTKAVHVRLFIDGSPRGHSLIEGSSADRDITFKVPSKHWRSEQHNGSTIHEACFHITHGTLIHQTSSEQTSLTKIEGRTYKVLHRVADQSLHENDPVDDSRTSERSVAVHSDHESSQEIFYDARSQFEHMPGTLPAEGEPIVEDPIAAGDDSTSNNQHILISGEGEKTTSITASPTEDDLARLDQAKREIFQQDNSLGMGAFTASSPSPVNASSPPVQNPDTEMLDGLAGNTEQSEDDEIATRLKKLVQTFGTIDGFPSSSKTAAQYGMNSHSVDPDDQAENLVHNRKTSEAHQLRAFWIGRSRRP